MKRPGDFRPVEISKVHGVRCMSFEWHTTAMNHNLCVDPARDDLVLSWNSWFGDNKDTQFSNSIEYQEYPDKVWVPSHWTSAVGDPDNPTFVGVSTLTACTVNQPFPEKTFATTFPEGTAVVDARTQERYVIGKEGAKTDAVKFESPQSLKIFAVLDADIDFKIAPQALKDALDFVAAHYQIDIRLDDHGVIDGSSEVECQAPGLTVRELLQNLSDQMASPRWNSMCERGSTAVPRSSLLRRNTKTNTTYGYS